MSPIGRVLALWLVALASGVPAAIAAEPKWTELKTPHFTVLTNVGPRETRNVTLQFEQFRNVFDRLTKGEIRKGERPITVIVVRNEEDLRALLPEYWENRKRSKPAGIFIPGLDRHHVALRVDASKELARIAEDLGYEENPYHAVFHEYVHALLQDNARLPAWLNEGLAEYYAGARIDQGRVLLGRPQALTILYLRERTLLPLAQLLSATTDSPLYKDEDKTGLFYAQSWALVHYLRIGRKSQGGSPMAAYSRQVEAGVDSVAAATAAFGELTRLQADLAAYLTSSIFATEVLAGATTVDTSAFIERALTNDQRDLLLARFHAASGRAELASTLVARIVAASPGSAEAADVTALVACRQAHDAGCLAQARRAIELGSSSGLTYFFAANALLGTASAREGLTEVQQLLERGLERQPNLAPALSMLANVYLTAGRSANEALALALRAIDLAPREIGAYLAAAGALMAGGRTAEAIRTAEQGVRYAMTDDQRTQGRELIEQLKRTADAPPAVALVPASVPAAQAADQGATSKQPTTSPSLPPAASGRVPNIRFAFRYDTKGRDLKVWNDAFAQQLQAKVPFAERVWSQTGHVALNLTVRKDGSLGEVRIAQLSGAHELDEAVRAAVASSTLSVPLPADYPAAEMPVVLTFSFNESTPPIRK
jgi:TonB family protein